MGEKVVKKQTCGDQARAFCLWLCNCKEGKVMNRTAGSWAKIGVFYLIYYSCLAGFWALMLQIFFQTLPEGRPALIEYQSLIKFNPGMGYRPQPVIEKTLIQFEQGEPDTYQHYIDNMQAFLKEYEEQENLVDCVAGEEREEGTSCKFDLSNLGPECTYEKHFGYDNGIPCVLLKMNKIYNWEPEEFGNSTEIPEPVANSFVPGNVGITCEGEEAADRDNVGPMVFNPAAGYNFAYFPYMNQEGYLQPLVMVQFTGPKYGVLLQVWCKVWAKNIYHDRNDRAGSVHFEMLID